MHSNQVFVYITCNGYKIRKHGRWSNGTIKSFFSWERSIKPNCMSLAAELDSNLIWIYTEPSLLCSLYFGFLAMLWFVLLPIFVVSFLSACLVLSISTKSTTFLAGTPFLVLCYIHLQYKFSRLIRKKHEKWQEHIKTWIDL